MSRPAVSLTWMKASAARIWRRSRHRRRPARPARHRHGPAAR
jgi:hypothetical protein